MIYTVEIKRQDGVVIFSGTVNTSPEEMEKIRASLPEAFQIVPRKLEILRFRIGRLQPRKYPRVVGVAWRKPGRLGCLTGIVRAACSGKNEEQIRRGEVLTVE